MKLAILGPTPIALETAIRFHFHGASITLFNFGDHCEVRTSTLGLETLKSMNADEKDYKLALETFLSAHQAVKTEEVISITKRFLKPGEEIQGKSRFHDLFRVIYQVDPKAFIEQQRLLDPAKYQKLSEEFVGSLQSTIEMYEDFDAVIDFRPATEKVSIAVSGRALGEKRISQDKIVYGLDGLKVARDFVPAQDNREMALIGSGALAAEILLGLESWLSEERSRLFIITEEEKPFSKFLSEASPEISEKLNAFFKKLDESHETELNTFHSKLREWQELDDFVQVKIPRPAEPIPQVNFFSGHNVTAVDELIDRKRLFLTLEKPDFREGKVHTENNRVELKTIGVDFIICGNDLKTKNIAEFLNTPEVGYYKHSPKSSLYKNAWEEDLTALKGFEDEMFKLFSPASHH